MRSRVASSMIVNLMGMVSLMGVAAGAQPPEAPDGCRAAEGAKASPEGYANVIIHEKTGLELILVPAGQFEMGSGVGLHQVTIGAPFYMGKTEVTNAQFHKFIEATGYDGNDDRCPDPDVAPDSENDLYLRHWHGKSIMPSGDDHPVVWVNWKNTKAFCKWAGLALPSEAQWEYACRAGTTTPYYFGEDQDEFAGYGWSNTSKEFHTHSVASKLPNDWGLYDMLGNVWEWVEDDYVSDEFIYQHLEVEALLPFSKPPTDGSARLADKLTKALRGGSWHTHEVVCRSSTRYNLGPFNAAADIGFRVMLPPDN